MSLFEIFVQEIFVQAFKSYVCPIKDFGISICNPLKKKDSLASASRKRPKRFTNKVCMRCFEGDYAKTRALGLQTLHSTISRNGGSDTIFPSQNIRVGQISFREVAHGKLNAV